MSEAGLTSLEERLSVMLVRNLDIQIQSPREDLLATGALDSLALVELLLEIEREFLVTASWDTLEVDDFRSVSSIAELVTRLQDANRGKRANGAQD